METKALIALLVGWFANEISHGLRIQRQHQAELCRAIVPLLEIRYILKVSEEVIELLAKRINVPKSELAAHLRVVILKQYLTSELHGAYNASINAIAAHDPLLAHDLTGRHRIGEMLSIANDAPAALASVDAASGAVIAHFAQQMSDFSTSAAVDTLEACIRRVAWRASKRLWFQILRKFQDSTPYLDDTSERDRFVINQVNAAVDALIKQLTNAQSHAEREEAGSLSAKQS